MPPWLSGLLIAQLPQQLHCGPRRPRLVSVEAAQAGDITTPSPVSTAASRAESPALASARLTLRMTR